MKEKETYTELATRLEDLAKKWTADCDTVHAVIEKIVVEQPIPHPDRRVGGTV